MARLAARHSTPTNTNRSRKKHQTATTQRLTAIPAVLPPSKIISQLAIRIQSRRRDTFGAYLAPRFHVRRAARVNNPAVTISHSNAAASPGGPRKGATKKKKGG